MREDRLLRPHQRPWLHPAVYSEYSKRFSLVVDVFESLALGDHFVESIVTFGGDLGFHTECRLLRDRVGNWSYELDCHEVPNQRMNIATEEVAPICDLIRLAHKQFKPNKHGFTYGDNINAKLPMLWYHATPKRLVWFKQCEPLQE